MREPLDGPVLAVMAVDSVGEAIALANDSDYALGASVWTADRYQALRIARELHAGMVWLNDHLPGPTVSRGPWGAAAGGGLGRTLGAGRAARVRAGEADHVGPAGRARAVVGAVRRADARAPRAPSRRCAPGARPTASAPGATARSRSRGSARARSGAGCRAERTARAAATERAALPLSHARPGLCRQGVRLPAAQGDLRPELRAGDARHALLHRLPEAQRPALRGRRRRRDRPREGRGAARLRRRGDADRARRRAGAARVRARGLDPLGAARVRRARRPRGRLHGDRRDRTTPT